MSWSKVDNYGITDNANYSANHDSYEPNRGCFLAVTMYSDAIKSVLNDVVVFMFKREHPSV